jgi:hypothetical protein
VEIIYSNNESADGGFGYFIIRPWKDVSNNVKLTFTLMRASDQKYLGIKGWQESQAEMNAPDIFVEQDSLYIALGPHIVDQLDMQENYRVTLADHGLKAGSMTLSHIRGIKYSSRRGSGHIQRPTAEYAESEHTSNLPGGGKTERATQGGGAPFSAAPPSSSPQTEACAPGKQVTPAATDEDAGNAGRQSGLSDTADKKQSHRKALLSGVFCLLLISAGGAFFVMKENTGTSQLTPETSVPKQPETSAPKQREASTPKRRAAEHLAGNPSPESSVRLGRELYGEPDGADAAFILFDDAASKGNVDAMLETGDFYSPAVTREHGTIKKDPFMAFEHYSNAAKAAAPDAAERLSRLKQWADEEARRGSSSAKALLEQF